MPPHPVKNFRADINGLRAFAVILVVLYHFGLGVGGGFIGVDVFFVISGYLMTRIISRATPDQPFRVTAFYLARTRRIVPALWAMVSITVLAGSAWLMPSEYTLLARHARDSLLFISNLTFTREAGYFDAAANTKWLLHTWSLAVEWQFYLALPWLFILMRKWGLSRRTQIGVYAALALAFFFNCAITTAAKPTLYFYALHSRAWELMAGGLVYFFAERPSRPEWMRKLIEFVGFTLILGSAALATEQLKWPGWHAAFPVGGAALVLFAARKQSLWTNNPVAQWLGFRSYSLYLWHWPVVVFLNLCGYLDSRTACLTGIAAALVLSDLSWRWIEEPGRTLFTEPRRAWIAAAALLSVTGFALPSALIAARTAYGPFGEEALVLAKLEAARGDWGFRAHTFRASRVTAIVPATRPSPHLSVILGDSHAEQWFPRINSLADRPAHVLFLTHGGCLPIPGHERRDTREPCGQFGAEAWQQVLKMNPRHLLITSSWIPYFFDADGHYARRSCVQIAEDCRSIDSTARFDTLFDRLEERVREAKRKGISVTLMGPIPSSFQSYVQEKSRAIAARHLPLPPPLSASTELLAGYIAEAKFHQTAAPINARLIRLANNTGAHYIDPADYLCTKGKCPLIDAEGRPLYKDESHLRPGTVASNRCKWFDALVFG